MEWFFLYIEAFFEFINNLFIFYILLLTGASYILFLYLRSKFPSIVNCWSCNRYSKIPYDTVKCWKCRYCDQYNGFTKDGDYTSEVKKFMSLSNVPKTLCSEGEVTNGLCASCNNKQNLKIKQLAAFIPINEANYDEEIDHFSKQLETWYKLCPSCDQVLNQSLKSQNYKLLTNRLNNHRIAAPDRWTETQRQHLSSFHMASFFTLVLLSLTTAAVVADIYFPFDMSELLWPSVYQAITSLYRTFYQFAREISVLGTTLYCLSAYIGKARVDVLLIALWLFINASAWTDYSSVVFMTCFFTIGVYLFHMKIRKKAARNTGSDFKITPNNARPFVNISPEVKEMEIKGELNELLQERKEIKKPDSVRKKVKEIVSKVENVVSKVQTRSQTLKKQQEDVKPEAETRTRLNSPPPDFYDGFNRLRIATSMEKTVPETDVKKDKAPFKWQGLRPSKLSETPPPTISTPIRSAGRGTPPSLFANNGKVLEEFSDNLSDHSVAYSKAVSPIYSSPRPYGCDYEYAPYPSFITTGFTPPYQAFPTPMGHTTVYTYSRPASYPCGFPSQRFSPVLDSHSPFSHRISEINDSQNGSQFFQNYLSSDRWSWTDVIKYGSLTLNLVSVIILCISYWHWK